jgi:hypothetical protein
MFLLCPAHPFLTLLPLFSSLVREPGMSDIIFVLITIAFFALGILYLKGCERLK